MAETNSSTRGGSLILVPSIITLAVTVLRLYGELHQWPKPWFSDAVGGGGAIIGISWLPFIFGPYFALKLAGAGEGPSRPLKAIGLTLVGLAVLVGGGVIVGMRQNRPSFLTVVGFLLMLAAAFIPGKGWRALGKTLLAYAFAARIPVAIVMFFAMRGNGGAGWGTHYDKVEGMYLQAPFWTKFTFEALLPQMCIWVGYTVVVGTLLGGILAAIVRRKPAPSAA